MLQNRWNQIDTLFNQAIQYPPERRMAFLDEACAGDEELRREIESFLKSHDASAHFLSRPAMGLRGRLFGPYRAMAEIGRGGMGIVYLGERADQQFEKRVAIKVIPDMFLPDAARRVIELEVSILAGLEHPNIARLLDAGLTEDGFRWIALEFINGKPLDQFAAEKKLNRRQRILLFQEVCGAVQYFHSSLIVHRDLKPSNILVDEEGRPKVVDFGIARVLTPADSTVSMATSFSPGYASPEQLAGRRTTTATDIFSLGAILYELLTEKPFRARDLSLQEIARSAVDEAPFEGMESDLTLIARKALRTNPDQRYLTVAALADDISRYLMRQPVLARPDSRIYRLKRFAARRRWELIVATAAAGLAAAALVAIVNQSRVAQRRFNLMHDFSRGVLSDLSAKLPNLAGNRTFRRELLQTGVQYLDVLAKEAGTDDALALELASGYARSADALSQASAGLPADLAGAANSYEKAVLFAQRIRSSSPEWDEGQNILASASAALSAQRRDKHGLEKALTLARERHAQNPTNVARAKVLAQTEALADRSPDGARKALAIAEAAYQANLNNEIAQRLYFERAAGVTLSTMFITPSEAWKIFEPALQLGRDLVAKKPEHTIGYLLATALAADGASLSHGDDPNLSLARERLAESLAIFNRFVPEDPSDYDYRAYSAMARMSLSYLEMKSKDLVAAIRAAVEGLEIMKPFAGTKYESPSYRQAMGGLHAHAARAYQMAGKMDAACQHYRDANRFYGRATLPPQTFIGELLGFVAEGRRLCAIP